MKHSKRISSAAALVALVAVFAAAGCSSDSVANSSPTPPPSTSSSARSTTGGSASSSGAAISGDTGSKPVPTSENPSGTTSSGQPSDGKGGNSSAGTAKPSKGASAASGQESMRLFPVSTLATVTLSANGKKFPVWLMDDEAKGIEGMMYLTRKDIPKGKGMLFVMSAPGPQSFWMENTYVPLDIIYLAQNGMVLNVQHGKPLDRTSLPSKGNSLYVIEFYAGDGDAYGLKPGVKVNIPDSVQFHS